MARRAAPLGWLKAGLLAAGLALPPSLALAADTIVIGVSAPLSGPMAVLGKQVAEGARLAGAADKVKIVEADDACTAEGGVAAARKLIEAKVAVVTGFLCNESLAAALPLLKRAGIPALTVGVRANGLTDTREKTGWPVWRLAPRGDAERDAAGALMTALWRDALFAIIDDGTIYGRELAESFRASAEQAGLRPVLVDTFRPQMENQVALIGRLKRAGATHVFVGGDGADIVLMERDAAAQDADIVFAGGETLRLPTPGLTLTPGTIMIGLPDWARGAPKSVLARFAEAGIVPEGYALPAYAAVQIAAHAARAGAAQSALADTTFKTALGDIAFDGKGDLARNPFRAFRFEDGTFVPLEEK